MPISLPQKALRYEDAFCHSDKVNNCDNANLRYQYDNAEQVRKMRTLGEYAKTWRDVRKKETAERVERRGIAATVASQPSPPAPPLSKIALQPSSDSLS